MNTSTPIKLLIDTDPGIDDSLAIMLALACPEFEIIGITTIFGNIPVELATKNALRLLELAGRGDIPVAQGASIPWKGSHRDGVRHIHGDDGQGNTFAPESSLKPAELPAAEFIVEKVHQYPGEVVLAALGPQTNLANALKLDPSIQHRVKRVVFMGGNAFGSGNATPSAEANMLSDTDAADFVMGHHWPMTMVGLDVTQQTLLKASDIEQLSTLNSKLGKHVMKAYAHYLEFYRKVNKINGTYLHDSSVFAYILQPDLFKTRACAIRVDSRDGISKGKTWPSTEDYDHQDGEELLPWANRPKVDICVDVDGEGVVKLLKKRIMGVEFPK